MGRNKLPEHKRRKQDTINMIQDSWDYLDTIGPSRGKAVEKLIAYYQAQKRRIKKR